jgi:hypothetical protein
LLIYKTLFLFFETSLLSVCQAETIFISLKILLIFPYTENTLTFQLNLLAGLSLIFCFSKSVWAIYLLAI